MEDGLIIAGKELRSRLILGTGRYRTNEEMLEALEASEADMVTVAIRRLNLDDPQEKTILDYIDWTRYTVLPNTAGSKTAEEAIFAAKLGREVTGTDWVKLEVIPDPAYLFPDPAGTLRAAEALIKEGFQVLPYIHADPVLARQLEELGCATVMPLGSAIGSGQGIHTAEEVRIIISQARVPVVVDAGLGVPSDASQALEMGASAVLVNTAIAQAQDPGLMGEAFKLGVEAGRKAYLAGRIARKSYAEHRARRRASPCRRRRRGPRARRRGGCCRRPACHERIGRGGTDCRIRGNDARDCRRLRPLPVIPAPPPPSFPRKRESRGRGPPYATSRRFPRKRESRVVEARGHARDGRRTKSAPLHAGGHSLRRPIACAPGPMPDPGH